MNLRVLVFLAVGTLSGAASANWFDGYDFNASAKSSHKNSSGSVMQSYPVIMEAEAPSVLGVEHAAKYVAVYFPPQQIEPKAILAPSFAVVAREMEKIKEQQQAKQNYALVTYLGKDMKINVE